MDDARIGTTIAGYRVESVVGRGGMGVVYLAEQLSLGRKVALKVLSSELASDPRFRQRFLRESRIAASLEDPNVVPIFEAGDADGHLFIAMRYVEGTDLKALIDAEGPLPTERVLSIVSQVGSALDAAHDRGLVHRDVKPANVLLVPSSSRGRPDKVYLADFGLTKRTSSDSGITGTGQFVGTLDYAAPEQFTGEPLSPRTDVYSLGCVLYEALTGRPPFPREREAAVMHAHLHEPPPQVTAARPDLRVPIDAVVAKALSKDPGDRHETAGALATEASDALEVSAPVPSARRTGRRPALAATVGAAAVVVAVVIGFWVFGRGSSGRPGAGATSLASGTVRISKGVVEVDPSSGALGKQVPSAGNLGVTPRVVSGENAVWLAQGPNVVRVSPRTGRTRTVSAGSIVFDLSVGRGAIWACASAGMSRIDPATNEVVDQVGFPFGQGLGGTVEAATPTGIWVATSTGRLVRIDPGSDRVGKPRSVAPSILDLEYGDHALWALDDQDATVLKLNPRTGERIARFRVGGNPSGLAIGFGSVWVTDSVSGAVSEVDPETGTITGPIHVGAHPTAVTTGFGRVWVVNAGDQTISKVDPVTDDSSTIPVGAAIAGITADPVSHALWVAVG